PSSDDCAGADRQPENLDSSPVIRERVLAEAVPADVERDIVLGVVVADGDASRATHVDPDAGPWALRQNVNRLVEAGVEVRAITLNPGAVGVDVGDPEAPAAAAIVLEDEIAGARVIQHDPGEGVVEEGVVTNDIVLRFSPFDVNAAAGHHRVV